MPTYTETELKDILNLHSLWLKGDSKGKRANLSGANLSSADLSSADLYNAKHSPETTWPSSLIMITAYWPDESRAIQEIAKSQQGFVDTLIAKYLVKGEPTKVEKPAPLCNGTIMEINGEKYEVILKKVT